MRRLMKVLVIKKRRVPKLIETGASMIKIYYFATWAKGILFPSSPREEGERNPLL